MVVLGRGVVNMIIDEIHVVKVVSKYACLLRLVFWGSEANI